jgi:uncharacterized protein (TIGR02147 family)
VAPNPLHGRRWYTVKQDREDDPHMAQEPNVFSYSDYRVYLRDFYAWKKQAFPAFSHRFFARKASLGSPNYLKLVMDGKRNLSRKSLAGFVKGLDLTGPKAEYFESLVLYNQATVANERQYYYQKLVKGRVRLGLKPLEEGQLKLFSSWYPMVIREMVTLKGFRKSPAWIVKALEKRITEAEAGAAFDLLLELGLLKKTARGFAPAVTDITTRDEVSSALVKSYHRQMIQLGLDSLERLPGSKRDVSAVTLPVRKADFQRLKERIQLMRKELLNLSAPEGEADAVVQMNFQLFPLTAME